MPAERRKTTMRMVKVLVASGTNWLGAVKRSILQSGGRLLLEVRPIEPEYPEAEGGRESKSQGVKELRRRIPVATRKLIRKDDGQSRNVNGRSSQAEVKL